MSTRAVLGVDIGTSSSKGVLVDLNGAILCTAVRSHEVSRPRPGWVEMDADTWWSEFVEISRELLHEAAVELTAVGVSGMGPCVLLVDEHDRPVRPAILYGVDTRASAQIAALEAELGAEEIRRIGGSGLSSQAAGPKIRWIADHEPDAYARARRLFMPSSWLGRRLTGAYVLDHHSASQATPLYDRTRHQWHPEWAPRVAAGIELPPLRWACDLLGRVHADAARVTAIPAGTPVVTGTIDAWAEAISVGAHGVGDLLLMYGTTMFLINTIREPASHPSLWGTVGALPGTHNLAGGMATSGAITAWLRDVMAEAAWSRLFGEARSSPPGANGLLMLPYFAGERTPIMDPDARGMLAGLTLSHSRGDVFRAALEATGFAVRHNVETIAAAGGDIRRVVAVGGGTQDPLWTQIVSDITGLEQLVPSQTVGAAYGSAFLAARLVGEPDIAAWNPIAEVRRPQRHLASRYDELFSHYLQLYAGTRTVAHALASLQRRTQSERSTADTDKEQVPS